MSVQTLDPEQEERIDDLLRRTMRGINQQAFALFGNRVLTGPFSGMEVPESVPNWDDGNSGAKLFGSYEHELHDAIRYAVWRRPRVVVNVGCAEGYYAIGLAGMMPKATIYGFELNPESRQLCEEYARRNSVAVRTFGAATKPEDLELKWGGEGHRLYIIDCEGHEQELVNPERCPILDKSDIIVECHDFMRPEVSSILGDRLAATHRIDLIRPRLPDFGRFMLAGRQYVIMPDVMTVLMLVEKRPVPCCWLACWANSKGDSNG